MKFKILGAAAPFLLTTWSTASAQGVWSLTSENDMFGGTDRHYSNGFRIERFSPEDRALPWQRDLAEILPWIDLDRTELRRGFGLTHVIFTPEDISRATPDPNDRPYAAWLAISTTAVATQRLDDGNIVQDALQVNLGIVGPSALGKFVQTNFHDWIDAEDPKGWDSQLRDEPGIEIIAQRLRSYDGPTFFDLVETDLATHGAVALGNVRTYASVGVMARFGFDLDSNFSPPRIRPSLSGAGVYDPEREFGGYAFVGVEGRAVARDIFLDGNTFRDSPSVDRNPYVWDLQAGVAINAYATQLGFSYIERSEEFDGQSGKQKFGAVSISVAY